jgi:transcription factor IIIB subunit 2
MNNFRRSIEEVVQVVKIADVTIRKRLEEFKSTPSGSLTVQDFRSLWLEEFADPPSFTKGKEKRLREEETDAVAEEDEVFDADDEDQDEDDRPAKKRRRGDSPCSSSSRLSY